MDRIFMNLLSKNITIIFNANQNNNDTNAYIVVALLLFSVIVVSCIIDKKKNSKKKEKNNWNQIVRKHFNKYKNSKELLEILYVKYVRIQSCTMNFDYDNLEKLCSEKIYKDIKEDLELLKPKKNKRIIKDYTLNSYKLKSITEENGRITIEMYLDISYKDYVIDLLSEKVVRGSSSKKVNGKYDLVFMIDKDVDVEEVCPHCGTKLNGNMCNNCNEKVSTKLKDFVLYKKSMARK